jgi:hypothetical protein
MVTAQINGDYFMGELVSGTSFFDDYCEHPENYDCSRDLGKTWEIAGVLTTE